MVLQLHWSLTGTKNCQDIWGSPNVEISPYLYTITRKLFDWNWWSLPPKPHQFEVIDRGSCAISHDSKSGTNWKFHENCESLENIKQKTTISRPSCSNRIFHSRRRVRRTETTFWQRLFSSSWIKAKRVFCFAGRCTTRSMSNGLMVKWWQKWWEEIIHPYKKMAVTHLKLEEWLLGFWVPSWMNY